MSRTRPLVAMAVALVLACATAARADAPGSLRVFAAASLTESFEAIATALRSRAPALDVQLHFAGSSALAAQLRDGAPADVVATADSQTMERLAAANLLAETPQVFAHNVLEIVVERGNPKAVRGLADLTRSDLVVLLAAPEVPAGRYARELLARARLSVAPRSLEQNVKAIVTRIALGEADAGLVYHSDIVAAGGRVSGVLVPEARQRMAVYPIAMLSHAANPERARAFLAFVRSAEGQAILGRFGFEPGE